MSNTPNESVTPFRCEVAWHAHSDDRRGPTCRPDSLRHPERADRDGELATGTGA
ncbi:hypothetical protein [Streptomyces sp. NPDC058247]|uniref:hypothetical protein n=1 Tax=Streptomyces sp. NPDC058247 TaxID=3346401 RepID=UPI0036DFAE03